MESSVDPAITEIRPSLAGGGGGVLRPGVSPPRPNLAGIGWGYWDWGTPWRDLGPVTEVPPGKDMGPVEVLWDGDGYPKKGH